MSPLKPPAPQERSFGSTMVAIAWSFVGLRRKRDFDTDAAGAMNPVYVIAAALAGTAILIGTLLLAVRLALA